MPFRIRTAARTPPASARALTRAINQYAKANNLLKEKDPPISGDDVREGLIAVLAIKHPWPGFESQTKVKLSHARGGGHRGLDHATRG